MLITVSLTLLHPGQKRTTNRGSLRLQKLAIMLTSNRGPMFLAEEAGQGHSCVKDGSRRIKAHHHVSHLVVTMTRSPCPTKEPSMKASRLHMFFSSGNILYCPEPALGRALA